MKKTAAIGLVTACLLLTSNAAQAQDQQGRLKGPPRPDHSRFLLSLEAPQIPLLTENSLRLPSWLYFFDGRRIILTLSPDRTADVYGRGTYIVDNIILTALPRPVLAIAAAANTHFIDVRNVWSIGSLSNALSQLPGFYQRRYDAECNVKGGGEGGNAYFLDGLRLY